METTTRAGGAGWGAGLRAAALVALSAAAWLPSARQVFGLSERQIEARRGALLASELEASRTGEGLEAMRAANPEWDLLSRMFLALSLANRAVAEPARSQEHLARLDALVGEASDRVARHGDSYFLLPYGAPSAFAPRRPRSLFVEGELFLMIAARRLAGPGGVGEGEARARAEALSSWMAEGPVASAESYPDECWTFCNAAALAALSLHDAATGDDHGALARRWVETAKARLVDPATGLLVSSFGRDGRVMEGPEGSSLWVSAHFLSLVDEPFARQQYQRATALLGLDVLGFRLAREWPEGRAPRPDIDSGAVVPLLEASAGSSGLWLVGASAMGDRASKEGLLASLELAAFPTATGSGARYQAAGRVGNAAALYALSQGPLFSLARLKQAGRRGS